MRRDPVGKMKTLDEVITANECCDHGEPDSRCEDCPYNGIGACCAERESDALQWLKGYRAHIELDKLRDKCETENDLLSWDELRTMEGKPVWVEPCKEWMLITEIETEPHIWLLSLDGMDYDMSLHEWQAYRKER